MPFEKKNDRFGAKSSIFNAARQVVLDDREAVRERERELRDGFAPASAMWYPEIDTSRVAHVSLAEVLLDVAIIRAQLVERCGVLRPGPSGCGLHVRALRQRFGADAFVVSRSTNWSPVTPSRPARASWPGAGRLVARARVPEQLRDLRSARPLPGLAQVALPRWSTAVFMNIARIIGAGPLIVIDTDVVGAQR